MGFGAGSDGPRGGDDGPRDGALHPPGAAAGTQNGQFVQLDADAVTAAPP